MYKQNIFLVGVYQGQILDLDSNINIEFKAELESGELQSIKTLQNKGKQNKGNLVTTEYWYLGSKSKTESKARSDNSQKMEGFNSRIRAVTDKSYKESLNKK